MSENPGATGAVNVEPVARTVDDELANVAKVAGLRAAAVDRVKHLDDRLDAAIGAAVAAGATKTEARKVAKEGGTA